MTDILDDLLSDTKVEWYLDENHNHQRRKIVRPILQKAAAEIERLREALTWYADLYNYQVAGGGGSPSMVMLPPGATIVDYDNGQRARKALE